MKLEWYVFDCDFNTNEVKHHNVFNHHGFMKDLVVVKKRYKDFDTFAQEVKHTLMYHYRSKCEWEVVVTSFPPYINDKELNRLNAERNERIEKHGQFIRTWVNLETCKKIDVYDQVLMNWNQFIKYLWENRKLIKL